MIPHRSRLVAAIPALSSPVTTGRGKNCAPRAKSPAKNCKQQQQHPVVAVVAATPQVAGEQRDATRVDNAAHSSALRSSTERPLFSVRAEIVSNFGKGPQPHLGVVNICRDKPFTLRIWNEGTASLHAIADLNRWITLEQVVCSDCPGRGRGVVTKFPIDCSNLELLEANEMEVTVQVASSKTKYFLPFQPVSGAFRPTV